MHTSDFALMSLVRQNLSNDLRKPKYRNHESRYGGHCYVASEALWWLLGGPHGLYRVYRMPVDDDTHWFLKSQSSYVLDPTADQFDSQLDYDTAVRTAFLTNKPSKRCEILLNRVYAVMKGT